MSAVKRAVLTSRALISAGHATSRGLLRNPKSSADHTNLAGCSTWSVAQILARRAFASSGRLSKPPKKTKAEKIAQTRPAQESARAVKSEDTGETIGSYEEAAAMSKDSFDFMADEDGGEFDELEDLTADDNGQHARGRDKAAPLPAIHRPRLPSGIKRLNKLLSVHNPIVVPDSEIEEQFVRGSGPGGQAINKLNTSVSLKHIPTGIRIQAQPSRSRETNRIAARRILRERLDQLRALGQYIPGQPYPLPEQAGKGDALPAEEPERQTQPEGYEERVPQVVKKRTKREKAAADKEIGVLYSKAEIKAARIKTRNADKAKKHKRKKREREEAEAKARDEEAEVGEAEGGQ